MEITLRRQGGLAGGQEVHTLDTSTLSDDERASIEALVEQAGFFSLPAVVEAEIGADLPQCELSVRAGDRHHTVTFVGETGEAELLQRLADQVARAGSSE
ncbi:MAG: hypothetical protein C5B48_14960 [Candidatus Rokuibacteriota bacterium]|nr:MAG: hypothetical protein C5B48_14960 [Candidatus Rokubacteria bacterium]